MEYSTLAEYLRKLRYDRRVSMRKAAERCGVSVTTISNIENQGHVPAASTLALIAEGLRGDAELMLQLAGYVPRGEGAETYYWEQICTIAKRLPPGLQQIVMRQLEALDATGQTK